MSADYDRLFNNSPGQADNEEATRTVDHATLAAAAQMSASAAAASAAEAGSARYSSAEACKDRGRIYSG